MLSLDKHEPILTEKGKIRRFSLFRSSQTTIANMTMGYLPLCFSFLFCCFNSNCSCFSASRCSLVRTLRSSLPCSCCSFKACWDFVPMPISSTCRWIPAQRFRPRKGPQKIPTALRSSCPLQFLLSNQINKEWTTKEAGY